MEGSNITVNDKPLTEYLNEEKGKEAKSLAQEIVSTKSFEVARSKSSRIKNNATGTNRVVNSKIYTKGEIGMYEIESKPYGSSVENVLHILKVGEKKTIREIAEILCRVEKRDVNKGMVQSYLYRFSLSPVKKYFIKERRIGVRHCRYGISDEGKELSTSDLHKLYKSGFKYKGSSPRKKTVDVNNGGVDGEMKGQTQSVENLPLFEILDKSSIKMGNILIRISDGIEVRLEISNDSSIRLFIEKG